MVNCSASTPSCQFPLTFSTGQQVSSSDNTIFDKKCPSSSTRHLPLNLMIYASPIMSCFYSDSLVYTCYWQPLGGCVLSHPYRLRRFQVLECFLSLSCWSLVLYLLFLTSGFVHLYKYFFLVVVQLVQGFLVRYHFLLGGDGRTNLQTGRYFCA